MQPGLATIPRAAIPAERPRGCPAARVRHDFGGGLRFAVLIPRHDRGIRVLLRSLGFVALTLP